MALKNGKESEVIDYTPEASMVGKATMVLGGGRLYGDGSTKGGIVGDPPKSRPPGVPHEIANEAYNDFDRLRVALGKHWYLRPPDDENTPGEGFIFDAGINSYLSSFTGQFINDTAELVGNMLGVGQEALPGTVNVEIVDGETSGQQLNLDFSLKVQSKDKVKAYQQLLSLMAFGYDVPSLDGETFVSYPALVEMYGGIAGDDNVGQFFNSDYFEDVAFQYQSPFSNTELIALGSFAGANVANITTDFSTNVEASRFITQTQTTAVTALPNIYNFDFLKQDQDDVGESEFKYHIYDHVSMDGKIDVNEAVTGDLGKYLKNYLTARRELQQGFGQSGQPAGFIYNRFKNIAFTKTSYENLVITDDEIKQFPMHAKIEMSAPKAAKGLQLLNGLKILPALTHRIVRYVDNTIPSPQDPSQDSFVNVLRYFCSTKSTFEKKDYHQALGEQAAGIVSSTHSLKRKLFTEQSHASLPTVSQEKDLPTWRLDGFLNLVQENGTTSVDAAELKKHLTMYLLDDVNFLDTSTSLFETIAFSVFKGSMKNYAESRMRTYKEIMEGKTAPNEIVLFRIEKQSFNPASGEFVTVQNIFLPNIGGKDLLKYFDTQVQYDRYYRYRVYAYVLVVGTRYRYLAAGTSPINISSPQVTDADLAQQDIIPDVIAALQGQQNPCADGSDPPCGDGTITFNENNTSTEDNALALFTSDNFDDTTEDEAITISPGGGGSGGGGNFGPPPGGSQTTIGNQSVSGPQGGGSGTGGAVNDTAEGQGFMVEGSSESDAFTEQVLDQVVGDGEDNSFIDLDINVQLPVEFEPVVKIIEVPYFNTGEGALNIVLDKPPLPPDVTFIPHPGNRNRFKFFFNRQAGKITVDPISFSAFEDLLYNKHRIAQSVDRDDPITFENDDANSSYLIYRSTNPPVEAVDLPLYAEVDDNKTFFVENIAPNTKYYYAFRVVDVRGNISYPSEIFEVELVTLEDGNTSSRVAVLPMFREYIPPVEKKSIPTKTFRKYMVIKPSQREMEILPEDSKFPGYNTNLDGDLMIVDPEFGKKNVIAKGNNKRQRFKLRMTSRKTGKKLDINFSFRNTHNKPPSYAEDNGKDIKPLFDGAERGAEDHGVMLHSDFGSLSMEEIDELLS